MACMSRATSAYGVTLPNPESGPKRTVLPTLPAARFSRLIATRVGVAFVPVTAIPPPTARPGLPCATTSATCLSVTTGTSLVPEGVEGHARAHAEDLRPLVEERAQARGLELGHERDRLALARAPERGDLVRDDLLRCVPGRWRERGSVAEERSGEPVRMIKPLQRRLAARAQGPLADRVVGVPLELHDAALAVLRDHAAAGGALATHGCEPCGDARHELFVRHHQRQDILRRSLAAGDGGGGAACRDDPKEVPPVHLSRARARVAPGVARDRHVGLRRGWLSGGT